MGFFNLLIGCFRVSECSPILGVPNRSAGARHRHILVFQRCWKQRIKHEIGKNILDFQVLSPFLNYDRPTSTEIMYIPGMLFRLTNIKTSGPKSKYFIKLIGKHGRLCVHERPFIEHYLDLCSCGNNRIIACWRNSE